MSKFYILLKWQTHLFKSQVRKAVFEMNNQEMVSSC